MKILYTKFKRKCGPYEIRHEWWWHEGNPPILMRSAYSPNGHIGDTRFAWRLWKKYGIIEFYKTHPDHSTCSIGTDGNGKWYGWSHRAIYGFKKGQLKNKGHIPNEGREYIIANPKRAAISFAGEVS